MNQNERPENSAGVPVAGWLTSDSGETTRRVMRGREERMRIRALEPEMEFFGSFQVRSGSGRTYRVEIRSLQVPVNSCECTDFRVNGLGTCKHIEAVMHRLQRGRKRRFRVAAEKGSPRIEILLDRRDETVRIRWPNNSRANSRARTQLSPFFSDGGRLLGDPLDTLPALHRAVAALPARTKARVRFSHHLSAWMEERLLQAEQRLARQEFEAAASAGRVSLDVLSKPLYPYQREGMLHLALTGRALLADEMGLGKTVQAIAACELLRRMRGIRRVLVVTPASLKGEWEEQIAKFTTQDATVIQGPRAERLRQYREAAFFYLANYEQVRPDLREMNELLTPDVVVRLSSQYAFVLTGTPIENRIDEIYSIVQFLNPAIFGPLFRFNRDFYLLDERGRPVGYRNLDELHRRLRPVMLRRRKREVEGQLPGLSRKNYFVAMAPEQATRYSEYQSRVARLVATAQRRPLRQEEMQRLQRNLACMRMLCDTPYILDESCRVSPKIRELRNILRELSEDGDHKIIVFSEWERMLHLVRETAQQLGLGYALHTGKVPQKKRRTEIRRFKEDADCRLFLATESGGTGLNLQAADVVINLDLPWNPARLEQRIARAWRKHQTRPVQVINLVCEDSIEHNMLHLLDQKRSLAAGVVDGSGGITEMALPSGRAAFLERVGTLMQSSPPAPARPPDPVESMQRDILTQWQDRLERLEWHGDGERKMLVVIADHVDSGMRQALLHTAQTHFPDAPPRVECLDRNAWQTVQRLIGAGVLSTASAPARTLFQAAKVASVRSSHR